MNLASDLLILLDRWHQKYQRCCNNKGGFLPNLSTPGLSSVVQPKPVGLTQAKPGFVPPRQSFPANAFLSKAFSPNWGIFSISNMETPSLDFILLYVPRVNIQKAKISIESKQAFPIKRSTGTEKEQQVLRQNNAVMRQQREN